MLTDGDDNGQHLLVLLDVLPALFVGGLGSDLDERRADLAGTVRLLGRAADGEQVEPSEALAGQPEFLLTGAGSASSSQMTAIICGDVAERRGVGSYWRAGGRWLHPFEHFWDQRLDALADLLDEGEEE